MWTLSKENKAKIPEWKKRWTEDVVLRTKPMTLQDKLEVEIAIRAMYSLANRDGNNVNVVFVRSPLAAKAVAAAAVACWYKKDKIDVATAIYRGTATDTAIAIYRITHSFASNAAFDFLFSMAVYSAICGAIGNALNTSKVIAQIAINATMPITDNDELVEECIEKAYKIRDEGNFNSPDCSYLCFIRDIIGFECEAHKNYKHYETCTKQSSIRYVHEKFCVISDFPTELYNYTRNGQLVAHNDKGPSHLWSDGFAIWTINGVAVTEQIVMRPETLTIKQIDSEGNEEVKRVMIERFTWARYLTETNAKCLDARTNDVDGTSEALMALKDSSVRLLCACKSTARVYAIGVDKKIKTCQKAQSWMAGGKKINVIGVS